MGGKAAILLVLGFSLIFLVIGHNFNNLINRSIDNSVRYYTGTNAYNIAVSGANMAAAEIFFDNTWDDGFTNVSYNGGTINVYVSNPLGSTGGGKVTICHIPPGNPNARHTLEIPNSALAAHLAHGDYIGACGVGGGSSEPDMITILAEGTYNGNTNLVTVELLPSKFSKFAYYSAYEPSDIWWTSGDTVWGPMHVQGNLKVANSPVFFGKVTLEGGLDSYNGHYEYIEVGGYWDRRQVGHGRNRHWEDVWVPIYDWQWVSDDDPKFYGGLEQGISVPLPEDGVANVEAAANAGGHVFSGQDTVIITFIADSINYKFSAHDPGTTVLGSSLAPNGVIFADDATVRISGTVSGRYTLGVDGRDNHGKGNLYFDDDIVYETDPRDNPNSSDLLGLVVKNEALITDNAANRNDINIHASVYVEDGGFGAENYDSRPVSGNINLLGGIIQAERLAVGTFNSWGTASGFNKKYRYDDRLLRVSPPFFPGTGLYEIVSWYE